MNDLPDPETTTEVSVDEVAAWHERITSGELLLVDCRERDEWEIARLPAARLVPLSEFAERIGATATDPDQPCIVYCHHGMRSLRATQWLRSRGHARTFSMRGGIHAWSEQIDPSVPTYG
jgi:adenylyltransferase/sulfurtransferase